MCEHFQILATVSQIIIILIHLDRLHNASPQKAPITYLLNTYMLITGRGRQLLSLSAQTLEVPLGLIQVMIGLPRWISGKESTWQCRRLKRCGWDNPGCLWVGKILGRRKWYSIQYYLGTIPWTEEPGGLQSVGSQRVGHDWATKHKV